MSKSGKSESRMKKPQKYEKEKGKRTFDPINS
jgi:hypothetical protein